MPKKPKPEPKADEPGQPYEATPAEKEAVRRFLARREGRPSAPKVSIRQEGETEVISLPQGDPLVAGVVVMDALGICEENFASWYLSQIIEAAKPGARADEGDKRDDRGNCGNAPPRRGGGDADSPDDRDP
jgi:hypothetical protein